MFRLPGTLPNDSILIADSEIGTSPVPTLKGALSRHALKLEGRTFILVFFGDLSFWFAFENSNEVSTQVSDQVSTQVSDQVSTQVSDYPPKGSNQVATLRRDPK